MEGNRTRWSPTAVPFTATVVAVMLGIGVATGALWGSAETADWYPHVAYGAPSLAAGRW